MAIYYKINSSSDGAVLSVFGDINESITSDSSTFGEAVQYLTTTPSGDLDPDEVLRLMSPKKAVEAYLRRVSDRVSFKGDSLLFDGDEIDNSLASTIIRLSAEDGEGDPIKLVKFLENLMNNPSEHSREQLYDWIAPRDITITSDGHFLAYKGLKEDFTSKHSGPGIVNNVEYTYAALNNSPGNVLEFPRSKVDDRSNIGCSVGLHAGTYKYASDFAGTWGKLVLVKINPRDVVSVPTDCDAQKLRVSRYEVLEEIQAQVASVLWDADEEDEDDVYVSDDSSDWEEDDGDSEEDDWDSDDYGYNEDDELTDEEDDKYRHLRGFIS